MLKGRPTPVILDRCELLFENFDFLFELVSLLLRHLLFIEKLLYFVI